MVEGFTQHLWETEVTIGHSAVSKARGRAGKQKPLPPAPTGYTPPQTLRPFADLKAIALDIETHDPLLKISGAGNYRGDSFIVGIAVGYSEDDHVYYPLKHKRGENCPIPYLDFMRMFAEQARHFKGEIFGANLLYDLDHLQTEGVEFPNATMRDVQAAEALLDENKLSYRLNILSREYLGESKVTSELEELYGEDYITMMADIWPGHAAIYGEGDTSLPWRIYQRQLPQLEKEGLLDLWQLECKLYPLLLKMRSVGVRVDTGKAQRAFDEFEKKEKDVAAKIKFLCGRQIDVWASESVSLGFDAMGIPYGKTKKGKPSFTKPWLEAHPSELARLIVEQRNYSKVRGTFLNNYILKGNVDGRIHCNFNALRSDDGGTVSGRFSSSNPNLQNIPARDPILGPLLRSIFIPEENHDWGCADWSQIEYRFFVHYAVLRKIPGSQKALDAYLADSSADFHEMAAKITGKPRKIAKNINFGVLYGMGINKMAYSLGVDRAQAETVLKEFHSAAPFIKGMYQDAVSVADKRGYIRTILGRRRRFPEFSLTLKDEEGNLQRYYRRQLRDYHDDAIKEKLLGFTSYDEILAAMRGAKGADISFYRALRLRREFTHKALNSLLQGSAADLMKAAMVKLWDDGIFNVLVPHLTVHDELDVSIPRTPEGKEAFVELKRVMENTLPLRVPVLATVNTGNNWDEAK